MFNWRPQTHSGWHGSRHHGHILTPRNIFFDMALVCAMVLSALILWKAFPARMTGVVDLFKSLAPAQSTVEDRVPGVEPPSAQLDVNALLAMTYDRSSTVRADSVSALGERGDIKALPRLQELQVVDGNDNVQQAAYHAEDQFRAHIATALYLPVSDVKYMAATESGSAYAVTDDSLYALRDNKWGLVGSLPDAPKGIAITPDAQTVYLATTATGLWRSADAGKTFKHIQFGVNTPTQLSVTALTINPQHTWQVFIALAAPGVEPGQKNPLGVFVSDDDGESWHLLPDSPVNAVTTRLVIHLPWTGFLYGLADGTSWRYTLPLEAM